MLKVVHNTAKSSSGNFRFYSPDNCHCIHTA